MRKAWFTKYQLQFNEPVLTSRGKMSVKSGYFLRLQYDNKNGLGECSFIEGLSIDNLELYENTLLKVCQCFETGVEMPELPAFPSIQFGVEMALLDLQHGATKTLFPGPFVEGKIRIPINGLIWMGSKDFMSEQIELKLAAGFKCIKIKVAAIDFNDEIMMIEAIRKQFPKEMVEIRLDANGGFSAASALQKLEILSKYDIHSIEQPIRQGQLDLMGKLCQNSPIPIALDEELISPVISSKVELINSIRPAYIILKPSLLGGFGKCAEWITAANQSNVKWWATSALESNVGLNAIAQWVSVTGNQAVQGLGTGGLYSNNIASPLYISNGQLGFNPVGEWGAIP